MKNNYPVTIYLNQKYVFDLLAIVENGISHIEKIKSTGSDSKNLENQGRGEIGASNIFALLGVKFSGELKRESSNSKIEETTKEKIHTPNSLFAKLRSALEKEDLIKSINDCETGDFIEVKCKLYQNPLISVFQILLSTLELATVFQKAQTTFNPSKQLTSNKKQEHNAKDMSSVFKSLLDEIQSGETIDIMGNLIDDRTKLIINLDKQFLNDPTLADLKDSELSILGKVTKILKNESDEKINLLRKTKFSALTGGNKMLQELKQYLDESKGNPFTLPDIDTEISAPAIQMLPIGIFA